MRRGPSGGRRWWRPFLTAALLGAGLFISSTARAAPIAVKLNASGVGGDAREHLEAALRRALTGSRHQVVGADKATYELSADVTQTGGDSVFKLRLSDARAGGRVVGERDGRCGGCDDAEAATRLQLTAESLLVGALETAAGQPLPAAAARADAGGWWRALPWVGLLGVAGASAAVHVTHRCRESAGQADACTVPLIGLASVSVLSAALAVGTSLSLATGESGPGQASPPSPRWAPWVIMLSGVAAGASGIGILTEDGYHRDSIKVLGYASLAAGAAVVVTSIGAIATRPSGGGAGAGSLAIGVAPGGVSLSSRF
ncbi:MAG TPA: hypothetical protein VMU50_02665 [Polyangia bacterium]|nr:hypothetical protein [Polyangia bacterium]